MIVSQSGWLAGDAAATFGGATTILLRATGYDQKRQFKRVTEEILPALGVERTSTILRFDRPCEVVSTGDVAAVLELAGCEVVITNPDKPFFPQAGHTSFTW